MPRYLRAVGEEIRKQGGYLQEERVQTVYFGGGTPSLLTVRDADLLLSEIVRVFKIEEAEITLEANPDDLNKDFLTSVYSLGFNRISIGIQSFDDRLLRLMNRRHSAAQALASVDAAYAAGFRNITLDLLYGVPGLSESLWEETLKTAVALPVSHLSAYHLTYHEGTPFHRRVGEGSLREVTEESSIRQFDILVRITGAAGFEQYEISNFAREGAYSRHNCGYWLGTPYLGLGPSAHSYDRLSRQWNVSDLGGYLQAMEKGEPCYEREILTPEDRLNDYLITRIRTRWGVREQEVVDLSGAEAWRRVEDAARPFLETGCLALSDGNLVLTRSGIMISDRVMLALVQ